MNSIRPDPVEFIRKNRAELLQIIGFGLLSTSSVVHSDILRLSAWAVVGGGLMARLERIASDLRAWRSKRAAAKVSADAALPRRKRPRPPLRVLDLIVKALWSAKTYNQVFKPVVADIRYEWKDARRRHENFRAWWIWNVRGRYSLVREVVLQLPWSAIKRITLLLSALLKVSK